MVVLSGNITTSWLHLASWNLLNSQLCQESKMEPSVAIQNILTKYIGKEVKLSTLNVTGLSPTMEVQASDKLGVGESLAVSKD